MHTTLVQQRGSDPAISTDNTVTFTGSVMLDLILVGGLIVSVFALVWFVKRM